MGMYDSFYVENNPFGIPYSKDPDRRTEYQTKCLECELNLYTFTPEGKILCTHNEEISTGETYTGDIFIYDSIKPNDVGIEWIEFCLTVDNGQVTNIRCIQDISFDELQRAIDTQISNKEYYAQRYYNCEKHKDNLVLLASKVKKIKTYYPEIYYLSKLPKGSKYFKCSKRKHRQIILGASSGILAEHIHEMCNKKGFTRRLMEKLDEHQKNV